MTLLHELETNKGTVSSALGKEIATKILNNNDLKLLKEAIALVCYELQNSRVKHIRAGAAKIVECVAEKKPELIVSELEKIIPGLQVQEAQTKWMIFMTFGYCAKLNPEIAEMALPYAKKFILEKIDGQLCLVGAIDKYLGNFWKTSKSNSQKSFPILLESTNNVLLNEQDWIIEGFIDIADYLDRNQKILVLEFLDEYKYLPKKATQKRIEKLLKKCV